MKTILIAALSENRVIGRDNAIPWHYPADLRHFRRVTRGHAVVAGRKTYETFQTRPLPQRRNFVLTRNPAYAVAEGVVVCASLAEALQRARSIGSAKLFVLGGAQVYEQALPLADEMILTHLPIKVEGDAYFPEWDESEWEAVERRCEDELVFATYRRRVLGASADQTSTQSLCPPSPTLSQGHSRGLR